MQIHLLRGEDKADDLFLETLRAVTEQNKWRLNSGNLYMQNQQEKNLLLDLDNDACKSAHLNLVYLETPIHFTRFIEAYRSTLKRAPSSLDLYIFCPYYDHEQSADIASFKTLHYFVAPENPNSLKNYLLNVSGQSKSMESSISSLLHGEFSRIVDYSAIISITDTTGTIIYANGNFCRISGYSRNELIGKNHSILKSGRHVESKYRNLWQTISSGKPWRGYFCNKNKANEEYWVDSVIYPMKAPSGEVKSYVSVRYDVTKEMRLKARLIESDKRFRVSHSFANVGSWEWDIETNAIYWSEEIYKLFGYEKPLLEANYDNFINAVHPDDRSLVQANVDACINEGTEYSVEHRVVYPDGTIRWLSERGHAVRDQNGTPKRMLGVVSDIHELKEAQETAVRAEKLKSSFISTLSHEIRNPLNALAGYNQLISDADQSPAIQTYSNKIKKIVEHISGILSDINLNARLESGNIVQTIEPIDLRTLVDESLSLMGKPDNNVTIVTEEITGSVLAEAQHLRQVILNLLSNACKYNRKNGHIYIRSMKRADDAIRLEIEDTGYGIAQENISAIFQPYERLAWQKSEVDGLGLGLPICKLLIKGMKGTIGATSKINCGSTFWIELAGAKVPPKVTTTESNPPKQQELPKNVLVLEDNEFNQEFMGEQLKNLKVSATFSTNGKSGLEILSKGTYDLVITDLNMPIMGGIEFIQRVRSHTDKRVRDLPIVVISADNSYSHRIRDIYKASFLEKPFSIQELVKTISTSSSENAPSKAQRDLTYPHIISDSIIDEQKMRHFLGDDIVVRDRLLSIYLKALKQTLPKIKPTAGTAEDALQGICHRMYSSSVSIGASPLAEEFSKLSELLKTGYNNTQLESQLQHLFVMTQEVIAFLENHYTNHHSAANTNKLSEKTVKILVIDDDAFAIEQISSKLAGIGSISFTAERDARTALKQLEYSHFDMIILDIDMPEIDGIQFIRMFAADYKGQALVLYSGESSLVAPVADLIDSYGMCYLGVLNKPSTKLGIYRLLSRYKTNNESQLDNAPPKH